MSLYYIKPIVWNTNGYQKPSGVKFTSGYPKDHGFGHEEWNNSPLLAIEEDGEQFRVFHTEGLGKQPIDDYPEDIFLFMIAAHDGGQYLVGVAGGATGFFSDPVKLLEIWDVAVMVLINWLVQAQYSQERLVGAGCGFLAPAWVWRVGWFRGRDRSTSVESCRCGLCSPRSPVVNDWEFSKGAI